MYNFRYHLVTIVSIFAALVLGLLLGVAITGSDLVKSASNSLAESLTQQFDELNSTNRSLNSQLEAEQRFTKELLSGWQADRLKDRTIVILTRASASDDPLTTELSGLITQSGGVPVVVRINQTRGILPGDDDRSLGELKEMVPEIEGESYEVTLARALTDEWSFAVRGDEPSLSDALESNYPLTTWLVRERRINVTVSYQPLLDTIEAMNATEALSHAARRLAYEFAGQRQLPYGANGVIDTAVLLSEGNAQALADPIAVQVALQFESRGVAGELPYPRADIKAKVENPFDPDAASGMDVGGAASDALGISAGTDGAGAGTGANAGTGTDTDSGVAAGLSTDTPLSPDASYFALLVQQDDYAAVMYAISRETGLSCVLSPLTPTGSYGVIALLSGATKGVYGLDRDGVDPLPSAPLDPRGNAPFVNAS
jgi:hypothetical protein